jgi:UrcA family protein
MHALSSRLVLPVIAAAIGSVAIATAPAVAAEPGVRTQPVHVVVRYHDLDLATDQGAAALYRRIAAAARQACPEGSQWNLAHRRTVRECREQALLAAVAAVGSPELAALASRKSRAG